MADNVEMQGIEFQIVNDSAAASAGVEVLAKKLTELKTSISGSTTALSKVAAGISQIKNAVNNMNTGDFANKINRISSSLSNLKDQTDGLKISASIGNQLAAINQAITNLPDTPGEKLRNLASGLQPLSELGRSNMTSFINQLKKLPEVIQELEKADIDKFTQQMKDLASAMKPFADEMNKVSSGFSAFPSRIQRLITSTEQYNGTVRRATTSTNAWNSALKAISFVAIYRAIAKFLGNAIGKSSEYIETLNLFTVSLGQYAEEAYNYAQKVSEVMGIDPAEWMQNLSVLNTIISGFGVAGDKAAFMSKNLTQLTYDLQSSYGEALGTTTAQMAQKVQSAIAGELEPLRRLGYDLSVARLQEEALSLGITKRVSAMNQAEKSQLRYYAMMTQVAELQGDMGRTLEQPANMLRILRAQLEQAARAIGNLFIPVLTKVLPIAIALASALRQIIGAIAELFGVTIQDPEWGSSFGNAASGSGDIADNMDSAAGSAKELKRYLAGFDELNVLPDQNQGGSGSGAGVGGGDLGLDLPGYDFLKNAVTTQIDEWKKKLEPLVSFVKDNLKEILGLIATIGIALLAWKLSNDFLNGIMALKTLGKNGLSIPLTIAAGVILTAASFSIEFRAIKDAIEDKLNSFNFGEIILSGLGGTVGAGVIGKGIGQLIFKAFGESAVAKAITAGGGTISTGLIGAAIGGIVAGIPMFVTGVYDAIVNGLNTLNGLLIPAGSTLAATGIGAIIGTAIGSVGGPVGAAIGALVGLVIGALTDLGILIYQKWDEICAFFAPVAEWFNINVVQPISGFFSDLWDGISSWAIKSWNKISTVFSGIAAWFDTNVIQPVASFFSDLWDGIVKTFSPAVTWFSDLWKSVSQTFEDVFYNIGVLVSGTWETIKIVWGIVSDWFDTNVIQPVASFFSDLWDGISSWAIKSWNKISTVFSGIAAWFDTNVIQPVASFFSDLWDGISSWAIKSWNKISTVFSGIAAWFDANVIRPIVGFFTDLWTDITVIFGKVVGFFKGIINGVLSGLNSAISYAFGGINSILRSIRGFSIAGFTPFSGLREISVPQIPMLADGGFVDQGQLFIAREAGAEMVGSIGRRTAVANNDQIVEGIATATREGNEDLINALYAVAQQIIAEMRNQDNGGGGGYDFDRAVRDAQRRNARMYG